MADGENRFSGGDLAVGLIGAGVGAVANEFFDPIYTDEEVLRNDDIQRQLDAERDELDGLRADRREINEAKAVVKDRGDGETVVSLEGSLAAVALDIKSTTASVRKLEGQHESFLGASDMGLEFGTVILGGVAAVLAKRYGGKPVRALGRGFNTALVYLGVKDFKEEAAGSEADAASGED